MFTSQERKVKLAQPAQTSKPSNPGTPMRQPEYKDIPSVVRTSVTRQSVSADRAGHRKGRQAITGSHKA